MKHNIELLKADIKDELEKIAQLEKEFKQAEDKIELIAADIDNYDRGAIGYLLHNFYNGCENIFKLISRFFENDFGPDTWHRDLLKRMKLEVPGYRPKVINDELYTLLDDFRAFRHKFRHTYVFKLDWDREQLVARKFPKTASLLREQIPKFIKSLDKIESE
jgi:hypothetical protein